MDKARAEWFRLAGERKRAKEERAKKEAEAMRKHREYWGIPQPEEVEEMRRLEDRMREGRGPRGR